MQYDLGYIDLEQRTLQTIDNPFGSRLSPMSEVQSVTHVSGSDKSRNGAQGRSRTTDTMIFSHVLYQLSYLGKREESVGRGRPMAAPGGSRWRCAEQRRRVIGPEPGTVRSEQRRVG